MCATCQGQNVPLSALANFETRYGPEFTSLNELPIGGDHRQRRARYSSEQATAALEDVFKQTMPHEMASTTWLVYQEQKAPPRGSRMGNSFGLSLLPFGVSWVLGRAL